MILNCPTCNTRFMVDDALIGTGREVKCGSCAHVWHVNPNQAEDELTDIASIPREKSDEEQAQELVETFEKAYNAELDDTPLEKFDEEKPAEDTAEEEESEGGMIPEFEEVEIEGVDKTVPNFAALIPSGKKQAIPFGQKLLCGMLAAAVLIVAMFTFRAPLPGMAGLLGMQDSSGIMLADVQVREIPSREKARFVVEGKIVNTADEPRTIPTLHVALLDRAGEVIISREYGADQTLEAGEDTPFTASKLDTAFKERLTHILVELGNGVQLTLRN